jgi:hypothetical protein
LSRRDKRTPTIFTSISLFPLTNPALTCFSPPHFLQHYNIPRNLYKEIESVYLNIDIIVSKKNRKRVVVTTCRTRKVKSPWFLSRNNLCSPLESSQVMVVCAVFVFDARVWLCRSHDALTAKLWRKRPSRRCKMCSRSNVLLFRTIVWMLQHHDRRELKATVRRVRRSMALWPKVFFEPIKCHISSNSISYTWLSNQNITSNFRGKGDVETHAASVRKKSWPCQKRLLKR